MTDIKRTEELGGLDITVEYDTPCSKESFVILELDNHQGFVGHYSQIAYLTYDDRQKLIQMLKEPDEHN